jgi:hypothetical protein
MDQGWAAAVKTRVLQTSAESFTDADRDLWVSESFLYGYRMQLFLLCVLALSCTLTYPLS